MFRSVLIAIVIVCVTVVVAAAFLPLHQTSTSQSPLPSGPKSPVLVELFTSEGCSSCPPADKLLSDLDRAGAVNGVPIIAMGEHVDYWDGLGWKDRFSSHQFTERQQGVVDRLKLDSAYTPQMVVDGRLEFVGNDNGALRSALDKAVRAAKPVAVKLAWNGDKLDVNAGGNTQSSAAVLLAITETSLTTKVERGENGGRVLQHAAVVRRLTKLGELKDSKFAALAPVAANGEWKPENLKAVVFVQDEKTGTVLGAQEIAFQKH